jgi:L-fucose isomerase-like protein
METRRKAAFIGFGEINTPSEIIEKKLNAAKKELEGLGIEVITTDYVYDDLKRLEAERAVAELRNKDFDFLVVCVAGWIPTYTIIRVISEFIHKPMLLWGLTGYYENGKMMTTADQAGTTALRKPMEDMGYKFKYVYSTIDSPPPLDKIDAFATAVKAADLLKHSRIGQMGYRDMKLYGTLFDGVSLRAKIGPEVEFFELLEITQRIEKLDRKEIKKVVEKVKKEWKSDKALKDEVLIKGAELYLAVKQKVEEENYKAISLIDVDGVKKLMNYPPSSAFMMLSDEMGLCTIPENDVPGNVTQLMTKYLTSQIGAYFEFYEFMEDRVLIGVPDYVPSEVIDGPSKVMSTKFGLLEEGILNISKVKTGLVTLCRLTSMGNKYALHLLTGMAVKPRKWGEIGWEGGPQPPSLEVILDVPMEDFAEKVAGQHYILSYGDNTGLFKDLCRLLDIEIY